MEPTLDVALPAGGRISGAFAKAAGAEVKALITLDGKTLLRRTIEALRGSSRIGRIIVIGPQEALDEAKRCGADDLVPEGSSGTENIFRGLELATGGRALISTTDMPLLTAESIDTTLRMSPAGADLVVPLVTRERFEARYPGFPREDTRLRDGIYRVGGIYPVDLAVLRRIRPRFESMFEARKNNRTMARLAGGGVLLRYVTRTLDVEHLLARAGRVLDCKGGVIRDAPPEIAYDIDLPEEYEHARRMFENAARPAAAAPIPSQP